MIFEVFLGVLEILWDPSDMDSDDETTLGDLLGLETVRFGILGFLR